MSKKELILFLGVFTAAAVTRAYLLPFPGSADLAFLRIFSERLADVGPRDYYLADYQHYLPGYLYVLWGIGELNEALFPNVSDTTDFIILKLPANFFDFATAVLIFKILAKRTSFNLGLLASSLYLFNPAVLYNSAVWGQFDGVLTFFLLSAVYFLLERKPELSAILLALAFLVKPLAIAIIPVFGLALVLRTPPKRVLLSAAFAIGILFFLPLPFFWGDPAFGMISLMQKQLDFYPFTSLNAFNLWWIFRSSPLESDAPTWLGLSRQTWGFLLWLAAQGAIGLWLFKRRQDDWSVYWAVSLTLFAFFILPTRIHERYLFPFFSFFLVSAMLSRQRIPLLVLYMCLSILHFLNLYAVEQPKPYPIFESFFSFALSQDLAISYLLVCSFVGLLVTSLLSLFLRLGVGKGGDTRSLRRIPGRR
ncbi:MAG: hypothetical protein E3J81_00765 [Dehalococcoidia bacterium]|nr:MAG: hypothetical protein E3J81_00765 [Dehalococcoidia bacterium]